MLARALYEPWIMKLIRSVLPSYVVPSGLCLVCLVLDRLMSRKEKQTLPFMYERPRVVLQRVRQLPRLQMGQMWVDQLPRESLFCCFLGFLFCFYLFISLLFDWLLLSLLACFEAGSHYIPLADLEPLCRPVTP